MPKIKNTHQADSGNPPLHLKIQKLNSSKFYKIPQKVTEKTRRFCTKPYHKTGNIHALIKQAVFMHMCQVAENVQIYTSIHTYPMPQELQQVSKS